MVLQRPTPLQAFQIDPKTNLPFLQLTAPHQNIIITPQYLTDVDAMVQAHNDPRVYMNLSGPPYPYLRSQAVEWLGLQMERRDKIWELVKKSSESDEAEAFFGDCPVRAIREVKEDGSTIFIGDIIIDRWAGRDVAEEEERKKYVEANDAKEVGDPTITWMIGDYLVPSHHGRGIMSAVFKCLMDSWSIPYMNARHVKVETYKDNVGSRRVFEKYGFVLEKTLEDCIERSESKGGGKIGLHILDWKYKEEDA